MAGVATVGTAGVEVLHDVLAETQSTIQPLVPYLDILRWALIAIALIRISLRYAEEEESPPRMTSRRAE